MEHIDGDWVYDLESYPNVFTMGIVKADGTKLRVFEVSHRKNETQAILKCIRWLDRNRQRMVGFNNIGFDYPLIHSIIEGAIEAKRKGKEHVITAQQMYALTQKQIASFSGEGFGNTVSTEKEFIKQVDLYKIHHFDNKAKSTSLKMLEFNMRANDIEDLPFPVGTVLSDDEIDELIKYNKSDVMRTLDFYYHSLDAIKFRAELSKKYGKDFTNANDTKVGKDYFISQLERMMPGSCYQKVGKQRKVRQSRRKQIDIRDCLFDYYNFNHPAFKAMAKWFANQTITETKGVFTNIEEHLLGDVANYAEMKTHGKKFKDKPSQKEIDEFLSIHPKGWIEERQLKSKKEAYSYWGCWRSSETLNVVVNGFRFDFGVGGIHGSVASQIVREDDNNVIIDADVASMYPNIAIANRVYPEHLSERFCDIYEDVYQQRKSYAKGTPENALLKLALNGVYGDSNNQYSPFYDPKYTMTVTINGQLSLCLLADKLMQIDGLSLIQVNTDGVTTVVPKDKVEQYHDICKEWEEITGLDLEYAEYSAMFIRDVNNYIALYTNGKVKRKGAYEYENLGWHQNQSSLVIPMAVEAAMVHGEDIETFIRNHKDKFDFMLRAKIPRNSRLVMVKDEKESLQQNLCRYYASKEGGKLVKIMPPLEEGGDERRLSIDKDWNVKTCNNIVDFDWDIDHDYYISGAKKLLIEEI